MRKISDDAIVCTFKWIFREHEVFNWVVKSRRSAILATSALLVANPATAKNYLERIYVKLDIKTRPAAAGRAMNRIR